MRQFILSILVLIMTTATCAAQSRTNYYYQYGNYLGSSTTSKNYSGGYTANYYDQYGNSICSSSDC